MAHPFTSIISGIAAVVISISCAMTAPDVSSQITEAFLQQAAAAQLEQIDLGQLATQKAESEEVKRFGARMVVDHLKFGQEVRQLASKGRFQLVNRLSESHTAMNAELTRTAGKEFDRAYSTFILREHAMEMKQLEHVAREEKNPAIRQWATDAVPMVKDHLAQAETIASSLGLAYAGLGQYWERS
ncbi:MAG: DUF4142 domain-containing protein [Nitrospira sp.]